jgi:hypothetical protein
MCAVKTIEEIRHANLLLVLGELAEEHGERGAIQRLADGMGRSHSQLSQMKLRSPHSRTGKPRGIGSLSARLIEQAAGKPLGWMDSTHDVAIDDDLFNRISAIVSKQLDDRMPPRAPTMASAVNDLAQHDSPPAQSNGNVVAHPHSNDRRMTPYKYQPGGRRALDKAPPPPQPAQQAGRKKK